ncbi:hypothetical protein ANCCAN_14207 [Ancylostoma caninum]|uniref:Uncharacterized protein n=1 Tax=Ancylostoma caninum TaxID=29170 RepID=A0A368G610_ANCCA|nr:hypothetical protein ANCCAN_14207 [Ancylostoma caninum]
MESLVIPFLHILRIINSPHSKDNETQSHGISVELDPIASKKLALAYAEALNDEQRRIIFYDLVRFDEPKMTITMLFISGYAECSWYKRVDEWVRRGNLECVTKDSPNGLVALEELPFTRWGTYLASLGVITRVNSRELFSALDIDENRHKISESYAANSTDSTVMRELTKTRCLFDVFDSDATETKDISAVDKIITENEAIEGAD